MLGIVGRGLACRRVLLQPEVTFGVREGPQAGVPKPVAPGPHVLQLWRSLWCLHPSLSKYDLYPSGIFGG